MTHQNNKTLPWYPRVFFIVVVLLVGPVALGMLFNPAKYGPGWFWPLKPFNVRFLGFFYLAEVCAALVFIWKNYCSPGRFVISASMLFTGYATLISALYIHEFNHATMWKIYGWFIVYGGSFLITSAFFYLYRTCESRADIVLSTNLRNIIYGYIILMLVHSIGLIVMPEQFSATCWPWPLDQYNGRFYAAIGIIIIYSMYYLLSGAHHLDYLTVGVVMTIFGLGAIAGLIIVDAQVHKINWGGFNTAFWLVTTGSSAVLGIIFVKMAVAKLGTNQE